MFGINAFAQAPFASLGNAFYSVSYTDTQAIDASQDVQGAFVGEDRKSVV